MICRGIHYSKCGHDFQLKTPRSKRQLYCVVKSVRKVHLLVTEVTNGLVIKLQHKKNEHSYSQFYNKKIMYFHKRISK